MYEPELRGVTGFPDSVLISTEHGFEIGRYRGNSRPESESFEIHVLDIMTDDIKEVSFFHKEDLYKNTEENLELVRQS